MVYKTKTNWRKILPLVLPPIWQVIQVNEDGCAYESSWGLRVIASIQTESDGNDWLHVSLSRRKRLPDWDDVKQVKDLFVGKERKAIQILPPESEYVNIHPNCLHLWCCLDKDVLPDFRGPEGTI